MLPLGWDRYKLFNNVSQRIDDLGIVDEGEIFSEPSSGLAQKVIAKLAWHMFQIKFNGERKDHRPY